MKERKDESSGLSVVADAGVVVVMVDVVCEFKQVCVFF